MEDNHDSKLERNVKAIRHYWKRHSDQCDCGCKIKIYVNSNWVCLWKLNEILKVEGYKIVRIQK